MTVLAQFGLTLVAIVLLALAAINIAVPASVLRGHGLWREGLGAGITYLATVVMASAFGLILVGLAGVVVYGAWA